MYGEEKLNKHNLLKYGLTKEFFEQFHTLKHKGIEIPLTLIRPFHVYIQSFVNVQMEKSRYAAKLKAKHNLYTMRDVQLSLFRKPRISRNLAKGGRRSSTVMPARFIDFALDKMRRKSVILVISDKHDRAALRGNRVPRNFKFFKLKKAIGAQGISPAVKRQLKRTIWRLVRKNSAHPIFGTKKFSSWLYTQSVKAVKTIDALEKLIRRNRVGVLIDHVEIVNPGTTLALLANKYNLPFINFPQLLIADRSLMPTRASHHFVWGQNYKDWLERRGIQPSQIRVTGNLRFQYAKKETPVARETFLAGKYIPPEHTIVLYTTQPFDASVSHEVMKWITIASRRLQSVTFLIKPHPNDKVDYKRYTASPFIKLLPKDGGLYDALHSADIVTTISSNTAIEAAMLDKAIIVLQPTIPYSYDHHNNDFNQHLANADAGLVARNSGHLIRYIRKYMSSESLRALLAERSKQFLNNTLQTAYNPADEAFKVIQGLLSRKLTRARAARLRLLRKRRRRGRKK